MHPKNDLTNEDFVTLDLGSTSQFCEKLAKSLEQEAAEEINNSASDRGPEPGHEEGKEENNIEYGERASTSHGTMGAMIFWELFGGFE